MVAINKSLANYAAPRALAMAFLLAFVACSQPKPPPPAPLSGNPASPSSSRNAGSAEPSDDQDDQEIEEEGEEDADEEETDEDEENDDSVKKNIDRGGAEIGDDDVKSAVKGCLEKGLFFDRFTDDAKGQCTKASLAEVDCTVAGLKGEMTDSMKKQFSDALASDRYSQLRLDQCLDCPPGNAISWCKNVKGETRVGTKLFFILEGGDSLTGRAMMLTIRPNQS